jgi:hypothetical protein
MVINFKLMPVAGPNLQRTTTGRAPKGRCVWMHGNYPLPGLPPILISGVTKDSTGAALASCTVQLFRTADDQLVQEFLSDGSGNYASSPVGLGQLYYAVAYKAGSPDVAGTTVNTLAGN